MLSTSFYNSNSLNITVSLSFFISKIRTIILSHKVVRELIRNKCEALRTAFCKDYDSVIDNYHYSPTMPSAVPGTWPMFRKYCYREAKMQSGASTELGGGR